MLILSAGSNAYGQLANGGIEDSHIFQTVTWADEDHRPTSKVKKITCGGNHTLILFEDDQLWVCGDGRKGQLGPVKSSYVFTRLTLDALMPEVDDCQLLDVTAAWETSYIVFRRPGTGDMVLCMGANDFGDRGIGFNGSKELTPTNCLSLHALFGPNADAASVRIRDIEAGPHHVVVSLNAERGDRTSHLVAGWGASRHGQLGLDDTAKPPQCYPSPILMSLKHPSPPVAISAGNQHTVVLHSDGDISGYGSNKKYQLSCLSSPPNVKAIQCTWNGTCLLSSGDNSVVLSGSNSHGQLGILGAQLNSNHLHFTQLTADFKLEQVSAGSEHVLALFKSPDKSIVLGWGWNEHGNLGLGHTEDVGPPQVVWPQGEDSVPSQVHSIWAGCGTGFIVLE
jgi:protein ATS1